MRVIDMREQSKFDWFNSLYFQCDWTKFDKLSSEINSRNAPWMKNSKTWRFWFIYSDVLFINLTRKKCISVLEFTSGKYRMWKICSTWRWTDFSSLSRLEMKYFSRLLLFWAKGHRVSSRVGFHGLSFRRICKTFWSIQTKLICCIEDFKVFAGNWTLVLCERNQSLSRKIFQLWTWSFVCRLEYLSRIMENGFLWREPEKKSVQPGTNWLSQCCDCMVFLPLNFLASA